MNVKDFSGRQLKKKKWGDVMKKYTIQKLLRIDAGTDELLKSNVRKRKSQRKKYLSESGYIRELIYRDSMEEIGIDREEFKKLMRIMIGCGNNLNQIAHCMRMDIFSADDIAEIKRCVKEINYMKQEIKKVESLLYEGKEG